MAMGLGDNEGLVTRAVRDMDQRWESTAGSWRDKAREEFEQEYLEELRMAAKAAQRAMKALDELLRHVIQECS